MDSNVSGAKTNRLTNASFISKLFFMWVGPVFRAAYKKKTVEPSDLYECLPKDSSSELGRHLDRKWRRQLDKLSEGKQPRLSFAISSAFGPVFALCGIGFFIEESIRVLQPLLLKWLTEYFSPNSTISTQKAYMYAGGLALTTLLIALVHCPNFFSVQTLGMRARIALCTLMYNHTLKLNNTSLRMTTAGHVNNLMTNDVNRFDELFIFLHYIWLGPLQAIVVLVLLWLEIGVAILPGVFIMILLVPLNMLMGKIFAVLRQKTATFTDQRVSIMTEVITAMRVIKMYAWEKPFGELVRQVRHSEVAKIINASYPLAFNVTLALFGNRLLDVGMIVFYALREPSMETATIFTVVSYCNTLRVSFMRSFPRAIQLASECRVSARRIEEYLLMGEKELQRETLQDGVLEDDEEIHVDHLTCSWEDDKSSTQLSDITFKVKKENLLAVVGPVGAGKSSLLMAILKELPAISGVVRSKGRVAYASQQPWVFGGTVRDNITFGKPFVDMKYRSIIRVCALSKDIMQLTDGDMTIIGERGVTLSGGQKARITLARALYDDADVYLLDDPLSAVDSEVSRHIFEKCIKEYLADKPRILVTHQLQFLHEADQILVLKQGHMEALGTLSELQARGVEFSTLMQHHDVDDDDEDVEEDNTMTLARFASGSQKKKASSTRSTRGEGNDKQAAINASKLFEEESVKRGEIGFSTYVRYFGAGGSAFVLCGMTLFLLGAQIIYLLSDYWLAYWADTEEARQLNLTVSGYRMFKHVNLTTEASAGVYGGLIASLMVVGILRAFITFHVMINCARILHNRMFACVIRTPILFVDTTPTGRIQNRFTKDIGTMDDQLPNSFFDFMQMSLQIIGTVLITCILSYYTIIVVVPLFIWLVFLTKYSLITTTAVKRLDGIARSPVFSHTTSSLHGLWTIRAYQKEPDFVHHFNKYQDRHTEAWFMYIATSRWFGIRLDLTVFVFITAVAFSCVPLSDRLDAGKVGLILTNCVALCNVFQYCVRQIAQVENQMTSVERVMEYTHLSPEAPLETPNKPPPDWPQEGAITFNAVSLAYSNHTPLVLKDITCRILPKEKIGIVGRTGAGKSSLITALFRLAEHVGELSIDNVRTAQLGLHDVRKKVSIIPQDPVIFTGSLRRNLDPFGEHNDLALWNALEDVQLHTVVRENLSKLDMEVGEEGSNFSVGQRQLICLARAILKQNRVLILDEATANVDPRTDHLIQDTIRSKFKDCTVLTIAHRLHTIIDSDRVMVLDAGQLIEFDQPFILLQDRNSMFSKLVEQTGRTAAARLLAIAQERCDHQKYQNTSTGIIPRKRVMLNDSKVGDEILSINGTSFRHPTLDHNSTTVKSESEAFRLISGRPSSTPYSDDNILEAETGCVNAAFEISPESKEGVSATRNNCCQTDDEHTLTTRDVYIIGDEIEMTDGKRNIKL